MLILIELFNEETIVLVPKHQHLPLPNRNLETFKSISVQSWTLILCLTLLTVGIMYYMERLIFLKSTFETGVQVFAYGIGFLFQRDVGGLLQQHLGSRVVSMALALALMIIMTAYIVGL